MHWAIVKPTSRSNLINLFTAVIGISRASPQYSCTALTELITWGFHLSTAGIQQECHSFPMSCHGASRSHGLAASPPFPNPQSLPTLLWVSNREFPWCWSTDQQSQSNSAIYPPRWAAGAALTPSVSIYQQLKSEVMSGGFYHPIILLHPGPLQSLRMGSFELGSLTRWVNTDTTSALWVLIAPTGSTSLFH